MIQNELTEPQKKWLTYARNDIKPVSFRCLISLWEKMGWGKVSRSWLQDQWKKIERELQEGK